MALKLLHVRSVLGLEEHDRSPVVRLVLDKAAGSALRKCGRVLGWVHGDVESITPNNLVKMGSVLHAGVDERICSFDDKLRARKSQHILSGGIVRKSCSGNDGSPLHRD